MTSTSGEVYLSYQRRGVFAPVVHINGTHRMPFVVPRDDTDDTWERLQRYMRAIAKSSVTVVEVWSGSDRVVMSVDQYAFKMGLHVDDLPVSTGYVMCDYACGILETFMADELESVKARLAVTHTEITNERLCESGLFPTAHDLKVLYTEVMTRFGRILSPRTTRTTPVRGDEKESKTEVTRMCDNMGCFAVATGEHGGKWLCRRHTILRSPLRVDTRATPPTTPVHSFRRLDTSEALVKSPRGWTDNCIMSTTTCNFTGCKAATEGFYCPKHKPRAVDTPEPKSADLCSAVGCMTKSVSGGMCDTHFARVSPAKLVAARSQ